MAPTAGFFATALNADSANNTNPLFVKATGLTTKTPTTGTDTTTVRAAKVTGIASPPDTKRHRAPWASAMAKQARADRIAKRKQERQQRCRIILPEHREYYALRKLMGLTTPENIIWEGMRATESSTVFDDESPCLAKDYRVGIKRVTEEMADEIVAFGAQVKKEEEFEVFAPTSFQGMLEAMYKNGGLF